MKPTLSYSVVIVAVIYSTAFGTEPANIDDYAKRSEAERPLAVALAKAELARTRKTKRIDTTEIRRQEQLVTDLENPLKPYYGRASFLLSPLNLDRLQGKRDAAVGEMGWVHEKVKVQEILSNNSFSVPTKWTTVGGNTGTFSANTNSLSPGKSYVTAVVTISGIPTTGMREGDVTTVDALLIKTPTGFKLLDLSKHADKFTRKNELRTWTSKNGGHTTEAIFVRMDRGKAILMKPDGKAIDVDLEKFSEADGEYLRKYISEQAKLIKSATRRE